MIKKIVKEEIDSMHLVEAHELIRVKINEIIDHINNGLPIMPYDIGGYIESPDEGEDG